MANIYVRSLAAGTGTGADWTNAFTTLAAAASGSAAGDDIWVSEDHAETQATAMTITFTGSGTSPSRCACVNHSGSVPPVDADLRATASVSTTLASTITLQGFVYVRGVTFNAGSGNNTANISLCSGVYAQRFFNCAFNLVNTGTSSVLALCNNVAGYSDLVSCTVSFGNVAQRINTAGPGRWRNLPGSSAITGAIFPTTLFAVGTPLLRVELDGLDMSALGTGKTIVGSSAGSFTMTNCKLGASVTVATQGVRATLGTDAVGCHSSGNVRRDERYRNEGTLTTETTIRRTAGAFDGSTAFSWKIATQASAKRVFPFDSFEGMMWNQATGSPKTLTVHCVTDTTALTDADIWLEVSYLGDASYPVASLLADANASFLATPANQATSTEAWTTTGITTPVKQKLDVTFTPQMIGPIRWKVRVGKASTVVYVCPKAELT